MLLWYTDMNVDALTSLPHQLTDDGGSMRTSSFAFTISTACAIVLALQLPIAAGPAAAKMYRPPASFASDTGELTEVDRREMPPVDNTALLVEAKKLEEGSLGVPLRFAHAIAAGFDLGNSGTWELLDDGSRLWRLRIHSSKALHLNLGFTRFDLPEGAGLWIYNPASDYVEGPYTAEHRTAQGELWTPIIFGDEVVIELYVPADATAPPAVELGFVNHGFRFFSQKQGWCNNDVICPEGDPWRDQIRSEGFYTIQGIGVCSGQLVNNTAEDLTPYFLSAQHCGVSAASAASMVVYWNYQSPVCGQLSGGSLQDNQSGAIFRASEVDSDFLLVELAQQPDPDFNVYYTGWNVSGGTPQSAVGIHHPSLDEKAISFDDDPLTQDDIGNGVTHWRVGNWEDGTTEPGSSGSGLWDPADGLIVGILTGGFASCEVIDADFYGMLSVAWEGGGTPQSRLRDWLDPLATGVTSLAGLGPEGSGGNCTPSDTVMCLRSRRFQVEVSWTSPSGSGSGWVVPGRIDNSGNFWFFSSDNWEMLVKVLDGCDVNGRYWVFAGSATSVAWELAVTDTSTGQVRRYLNPRGVLSPALADTSAFATCP
ncbi:MAG: hypothetical protein GY856_42445 [bacterium]|nr:hypothetical protein [bacterium]